MQCLYYSGIKLVQRFRPTRLSIYTWLIVTPSLKALCVLAGNSQANELPTHSYTIMHIFPGLLFTAFKALFRGSTPWA
jgi:hypothetical protein